MLSPDGDIEHHLQAASERIFPHHSQPRVVDLVQVSDGWECDVYAFVLEGGPAASPSRDNLILRIYQGNRAVLKARTEFDAMRQLRAAGYPVPRVLTLVVDDSPFDRPFVIMEKIDGPILGRSIEAATGDRRRALLSHFCRIVVDLHALDPRAVVPEQLDGDVAGSIDRWLSKIEAILRQFPIQVFDPALSWVKDHRARVTSTRLSIIHQDLHPWNVLLDSTGAAYVIDWTQADVSDFRLDLAWSLLILRTSIDRATRDDFLHEYERLIGAPIEDLAFFEAIAATKRLASIYLSVTAGAESLGMRAGAESRMLEERSHLLTARAVLHERTGLRLPAIEDLVAGRGDVSPLPVGVAGRGRVRASPGPPIRNVRP